MPGLPTAQEEGRAEARSLLAVRNRTLAVLRGEKDATELDVSASSKVRRQTEAAAALRREGGREGAASELNVRPWLTDWLTERLLCGWVGVAAPKPCPGC